ncbi:hypothetical protein SAMN04488030_0290 [Aliiroseovarius halocynthiae]|uniref:DUF2332 domain-containing protein n=1 Tax=Aliiroseovarius halocynthiae TaxID=985055 RepID=A0A545SYH0_9RHOB|nr:DUF2332 domain-containing protein [Aliiroseovarius halocynthiae]TQV70010.1 DUF2332 domain-containing protein [Aliiroseovarius halocynthiae]SMR70678.1 hypothetical protein SAMN04488030_0290 [Aliiroseovarius halocynthiae]
MSLRDAFTYQAESNRQLGSPFTARVLDLLAQSLRPGTPLTDRMFDWPGDLGPSGQSLPLRFLAGLHALVLTGNCAPLVTAYPANPTPNDDQLSAALNVALSDHADVLNQWLDLPPQTNEVRRAAVMISMGHWLAAQYDLPMRVYELGASAGLNLMWDRFALQVGDGQLGPEDAPVLLTPDWRADLPTGALPTVLSRRGVDLMPMDITDPDDLLRMSSYLWADQPERLARSRAAAAIFDAHVDQGDAAEWLEAQLKNVAQDHLTLIYHTIAWQYFPPATQDRCLAAIETAAQRGPIAHLSMEADEQDAPGAAITLTLWPEGRKLTFGRVDFHGRWVDWTAP